MLFKNLFESFTFSERSSNQSNIDYKKKIYLQYSKERRKRGKVSKVKLSNECVIKLQMMAFLSSVSLKIGYLSNIDKQIGDERLSIKCIQSQFVADRLSMNRAILRRVCNEKGLGNAIELNNIK